MTSSGVAKGKGEYIDRCHRCGGLMVSEEVLELRSFDWRCVSCGERIDAVILAHRKQDFVGIETEKTFAAKRKDPLN